MSKKNQKTKDAEVIESIMLKGEEVPGMEKTEAFDFTSFKFKKISDFDTYNSHVRKHNRLCLHERNKMKIKVPDESFYKKVEVRFQKNQQPENIQKVFVRNKDISWKGQLKSGGKYKLPMPVIKFLNNLTEPVFAEVKVNDGSKVITETKQVDERNKFSCSVVNF